MATNARDARRRRILQGSQDRLNLITGRVQNIPSTDSQPIVPDISIASNEDTSTAAWAQSPPFVSRDLDPIPQLPHPSPDKPPTDNIGSRNDQAAESSQNDSYGAGIREEPSLRRRGTGNDLSRVSSEVSGSRPGPSSAVRRQPTTPVSLPEQFSASLVNLFRSVTSQQLNTAISSTEQTRRVVSITMALLVLLSYFGFPIVGNKIIKSILLFRPLLLLLLMNVSLVILRLLAEHDGKKDAQKLSGSEGLSWAEEAGRALEVGLMLQNVLGSLFMDFSVYALIIVCGFCLAS